MRVLAVTGTRADWGLLVPVLDLLRRDPSFDLRLLVTGQHLEAGSPSIAEIEGDGFTIHHRVDMDLDEGDDPAALAKAMGEASAGTGRAIAEDRPDLLLVLGDRYEILATAGAATVARLPIVHLCGGDITEGAFDDAIRHAITKLSALHFTTNAAATERLLRMGEDPARVHTVGSTGLDRVRAIVPMDRAAFLDSVGLAGGGEGEVFLVTFHPPTLSDDSAAQCAELVGALDRFGEASIVVTGSNADPGGREIDARMRDLAARRANVVFHPSLGSRRYFSALHHCDVVIGNSSSGLYEAPSFDIPTVNIGDRQKGRPRAVSVIDCAPDRASIAAAIETARTVSCEGTENPYGDGHAAPRIVEILSGIDDPAALTRKRFFDGQPPR